MDAATWGFIGTVVGAVVGASVSILTTLISGWNSARLQNNADTLKRLERAREFQRNNLLEIQDSLAQYMRLVVRAHLEDVEFYRKDDCIGSNFLSDELEQELMLSSRKLTILTERISDDVLRNNLKELRQKMTCVSMAMSEDESRIKLQNAGTGYEQFMEQLGVMLRNNY